MNIVWIKKSLVLKNYFSQKENLDQFIFFNQKKIKRCQYFYKKYHQKDLQSRELFDLFCCKLCYTLFEKRITPVSKRQVGLRIF